MTVAAELTARQRQMIDTIVTLTARNGYPPTLKELAAHFGVVTFSVVCVLKALRRKGWVDWDAKHSRTLRVLKLTKSLSYIAGARDALRMLDAPEDVVKRVFAQLEIS